MQLRYSSVLILMMTNATLPFNCDEDDDDDGIAIKIYSKQIATLQKMHHEDNPA